VLATALSLYAASVIYDDWRMSDAVTVEEAFEEHRVSFPDFQPNVPVEVLSFPVTERFEDVPRFTVLLNDWGLRERPFEREPAAGVQRIMAVGESSTFGTGLATGERFTELLAERLERDRPGCCEVLNAGSMGMTTPSAVQFVHEELPKWKPDILIYDTMANDLRDPDHPMALDDSSQKVGEYEANLRLLAKFCQARGISLVFWANSIALYPEEEDQLQPYRDAMKRVASAHGAGFTDLRQLYEASPATPVEIRAFLESPNWTQFHDVLGPNGIPIEQAALYIDWVHPNQFGSQRLADGLLPLIEERLDLTSLQSERLDPSSLGRPR